ncbi:hypothetical protein JHK82_038475 [Glycine max]|nr:hypothetical protein JHK85_039225 [Glycine max]KAG5109252.1 hypothetical protein JHK82_038475 [Glycine max]
MLLQNENRTLWKLGTLPPGLITYYSTTKPLDKSWHVLGLGYNPSISMDEIRNAAVVHFNGNMKPWLDIAMTQFKPLRSNKPQDNREILALAASLRMHDRNRKRKLSEGASIRGSNRNSNTLSAGVESIILGSGVATHIKSSGSDILAQDFQVVEQDDKLNEGNTGIKLLGAHKHFVDLDDAQIALLAEAIAAYPQLGMLVRSSRENEFHKLCNEAVQLGFERSWVDEMRQRVVARDPAWTMHKHELLSFLRGMIIWLKFHLATLCDNWEYLLLIPISHLLPELEHLILNQNSRPVHVSV